MDFILVIILYVAKFHAATLGMYIQKNIEKYQKLFSEVLLIVTNQSRGQKV